MKKVLFIAYLYPPIFNSGTRRSLEFVNHLPDNGWTPIVLTVANPAPKHCDPALLEEVRPGTRIERVPFWSDWAAEKLAAGLGPFFEPQRMAERLAWRLKSYWAVPDACALWSPLAVKRGIEIHRNEGFDAIYATGWPWTSFLIAERISRQTGCPYVIDYRDLWKPAGVEWDKPTRLQQLLNPRLERQVLRNATAVITVTKGFGDILIADAGESIKPICITNGFDPDDFPALALQHTPEQAIKTVVYTGVWRPGYGPDDLYLAVKHLLETDPQVLQRVRFVLAGFPPGPAKEHGIDAYVEELGRVPHSSAIDLMCKASALYLPVSKGLYEHASLPGKLFEYMGSGRPVLASALPGSEVETTLVEVGGACCVVPGDIQGLAKMIRSLARAGGPSIFSPRRPDSVAQYTRSSLTRRLATVLDGVSDRRPGAIVAAPTNVADR
jgi:glycosyltransferase involved in cell wall biosynthesis